MSIRFQCPGCDNTLKVPERLAGRKGKCPACGAEVSVPDLATAFEAELAAFADPPAEAAPFSSAAAPPSAANRAADDEPFTETADSSEPGDAAWPEDDFDSSASRRGGAADPDGDFLSALDDPDLNHEENLAGRVDAGDGPTYDIADGGKPARRKSEFAAEGLPPRLPSQRKKKARPKTFQAAQDDGEPKPSRRRMRSEFAPVAAGPATGRDHLFWLFALALIPLAISIVLPEPEPVARIEEIAEQLEDIDAENVDAMTREDFMERLEDKRFPGALLAYDSWLHWAFAVAAAVVFLGVLISISGQSVSTANLLTPGVVTGTMGILLLLGFQWIALWSNAIWLRGRGIVILIFLLVKFIGFSYYCALNPENGFLLSFMGFTCAVGLCEELVKAIPVVWYIHSPQANWRGAMLVGMASGIGFGISEGIMYSSDFYNGYAGGMIYLVRFASCVNLHAVWSGAVALIMFSDQSYTTDVDWEGALMFVVKYLGIAMILHGLYDTLLKKELELGALLVAGLSWAWLAWLFYRRRADGDALRYST
ncbi:MAG: PrsW family glutamic-type intramembrane protease [Planctomycetaceae bacterium]